MPNALQKLDWSLVQAFVGVMETGSLSAAARALNLTQPTLGRQIAAMEQALGLDLFLRRPRGMEPTEAALALLPAATAMRNAARDLELAAAGRSASVGGTVRITASIFASHHILPPILARLRLEAAEIELELVPSDSTENLLFREADIAVRMYRPTQLDVVTRHIGDIEIGVFAAKSYLERAGVPKSMEDILDHDFVGFDRNDDIIRGFRAAGFELDRGFFGVRCDHQTVYWELVRAGCGLGFCQVRQARADPLVERVALDIPIPALEVWLTAPEAIRHSPTIARVWESLADELARVVDR